MGRNLPIENAGGALIPALLLHVCIVSQPMFTYEKSAQSVAFTYQAGPFQVAYGHDTPKIRKLSRVAEIQPKSPEASIHYSSPISAFGEYEGYRNMYIVPPYRVPPSSHNNLHHTKQGIPYPTTVVTVQMRSIAMIILLKIKRRCAVPRGLRKA